MKGKLAESDKEEIISKFERAQKNVTGVISKLEADCSWQSVHKQISTAIYELRQATTLLVRRRIENCVIEHKRKHNLPIVQQEVNEVVSLYRYLD